MKNFLFTLCAIVLCLTTLKAQIVVNSTITNPTCSNSCDGKIAITVSGGSPNYSINISNSSNGTNLTYTTTPGTYTVTGLCGSSTAYVYTIQDALGNTTGNVFNITSPMPMNITGSSSYTVCEGSCKTIAVSAFFGPAPFSFSWAPVTAFTNSVNVCPPTTTNYTVIVTDANGCVGQKTINVNVNATCQDVWPGDANSDGTSDNLDVLELGLHYTQTGAARTSISNNWQSYFANNWTGTISNGKNVNHSDCNGDGTINASDTLAIYNNYGLSHAFKQSQQTVINPQLTIVPDQPMVAKGTWGSASVYLGDATTTITNINGVAFTITYDNTLIETNSVYLEYTTSFINSGDNLHFRKTDFAIGKLYTASTHTLNNNVTGYGKIATLHYQIKSSLATDNVLNLGLIQVNQSDASGVITPLTSGTGTLMAIGASVGIHNNENSAIGIYPSPATNSITISGNVLFNKIELITITGQIIRTENLNSTSHIMDLSSVSNGIYFVNTYSADKIISRKKIIIAR
jgi:hypothetical protein